MFAPSPYTSPPASWTAWHISRMLVSNRPQCVGQGQHQPYHVGVAGLFKGVQVHVPLAVRGYALDPEAAHGRRGRVGAVGAVRDQDGLAMSIAAGEVVSAYHQHSAQFALSACEGRKAGRLHPRNLRDVALKQVGQLQRALDRLFGLKGMNLGKPGHSAASSFILGLYFIVQLPRDSSWCPRRSSSGSGW